MSRLLKITVAASAATVLMALAQAPLSAAETERPEGWIVAQGGAVITFIDVDARVARIPPETRAEVMDSPQRIEEILRNLLVQRQLAEQARAIGLDQDPSFLREIALITEEALSRRLLEHRTRSAEQPDFSMLAEEYYRANAEEFRTREQKLVSHILITAQCRSDDDARELAERVREEAAGGDIAFTELVARYSEDPSHVQNKGVIGPLGEGLDPDFVSGGDKLVEPGDISAVVRTQFGYHVIRLDEVVPSRQMSFEQVRQNIILSQRDRWLQAKRSEPIHEARGRDLDINPDAVAELRTRYRN